MPVDQIDGPSLTQNDPGFESSTSPDAVSATTNQCVSEMLQDWGWMKESSEEEPNDDAKPWVLAIDDDPDVSLGIQKRLEVVGVDLLRAYRGMEGYRSAFQGQPAAILLDYEMPDGNGEYILRRLKESSATDRVPVIVITGVNDMGLKRRMMAAGACEFLNKPATWEQIRRTLLQYTDLSLRPVV